MYHNNIAEQRSTRVAAPPGGRSSFTLGGGTPGDDAPTRGVRRVPARADSGVFGSATPTAAAPAPAPAPAPTPAAVAASSGRGSVEAKATPLAPAPQPRAAAGMAPADRRVDTDIHSKPSTRVHAAPGGRSDMGSIIGGGGGGGAGAAPSGRGARENLAPASAPFATDDSSAAAPVRRGGRGRVDPNARSAEATAPMGTGPGGSAHSSTRVHHAPGGRSSGNILSWQ